MAKDYPRLPVSARLAAADVAGAVLDGEADELHDLLLRASRMLDRMWRQASTPEELRRWMRLGEASHSLHRALVALGLGDELGNVGSSRV